MRRFLLIAFVCAFSVAWGSTAHAQSRIALVVAAYQHTPRLENPRNDAADVAAALRTPGFQVLDLDKPGFDRKVRDFAAALKGSDAGVFFYPGHGLQVAGHNYGQRIEVTAGSRTCTLTLREIHKGRNSGELGWQC
jgi:hypothetical protein